MIHEELVRKSNRLQRYDYSTDGAYFITICTQKRKCLFGKIINNQIELNEIGKMIEREWNNLPMRFPKIELDQFIVMPNHLHGIIINIGNFDFQNGERNAPPHGTQNGTIGRMIQAFKSSSTNEYIKGVKFHNWPRFERGCGNEIIRNILLEMARYWKRLANTYFTIH